MSKPLRYKIGDKIFSDLDIRQHAYKKADGMSPETKKAYLDGLEKYFDFNQQHIMKQTTSSGIVVPTIGLLILVTSVCFTFLAPNPTRFQSGVIWVFLCIGAGISAVLIPGYFYYEKHPGFRAGGGFALAILMYFAVPAIMSEDLSKAKERIHIYVASADTASVHDFHADFDHGSTDNLTTYFASKFTEFMGQPCEPDSILCFQKADGKIFANEKCTSFTLADIIIVHKRVAGLFATPRAAYLHFSPKCL